MNRNNDGELFDSLKDAESKDDKHGIGSTKIENRPDINKISKRNEEEEKKDKRVSYYIKGIIVLLVIVVMFLIYFFSWRTASKLKELKKKGSD